MARDDPGRWIAEGVDRSGVLAVAFEINNAVEKALGLGAYRALAAAFPDKEQGPQRPRLERPLSPVTTAAAALACRSALLDGEMVVQTADGRSDIAALQAAVSGYRRKAVSEPNLVFYAFNLIHLDGADLRGCRLEERRDALAELLPADATRPILFSEALVGDGAKILAAADRLGLEGVVSKRAGSRYPRPHQIPTQRATAPSVMLRN